MKKTFLFIIAILTASYSAFAIEQQTLQLDVVNNYYDYSELGLGNAENYPYLPLKSNENGYVPGIQIAYQLLNREQGTGYRLNLYLGSGNITYDGSDMYTGNTITGKSSATFMDISAILNLFAVNDGFSEFYAGIGYHQWQRGVNTADSGGGYDETYSWGYVPVGIRHTFDLGDVFTVTPDFSLRMMILGSINIPSYNAKLALGNRVGYDFRIPVEYWLDKVFAVSATPWVDYSEIGQSNSYEYSPGHYVSEPSSRTWQGGVNIGIKIAL